MAAVDGCQLSVDSDCRPRCARVRGFLKPCASAGRGGAQPPHLHALHSCRARPFTDGHRWGAPWCRGQPEGVAHWEG